MSRAVRAIVEWIGSAWRADQAAFPETGGAAVAGLSNRGMASGRVRVRLGFGRDFDFALSRRSARWMVE
jgi:hypothetical protein